MMAESNEIERVREEIIHELFRDFGANKSSPIEEPTGDRYDFLAEVARQILKIEGLAVLADNQELPFISLEEAEEHDAKWSLSNFTDSLQEFGRKKQKSMKNAGWRKVVDG